MLELFGRKKVGIKYCPKCGAQIPITDNYCTSCGYSFAQPPKKGKRFRWTIIIIVILIIAYVLIRIIMKKPIMPDIEFIKNMFNFTKS